MAYIRARVTEQSYEGWRNFAEEHGVSIASLIEAAGVVLATNPPAAPARQHIIKLAREVDAERRRRR